MSPASRRLIAVALWLAPVGALACAILPEPQQIQVDAQEREELTQLVRTTAARATHVFIARVGGIDEEYEDRTVDGEQQTFKVSHPSFELISSVKGAGDVGNLFWEENRSRVIVSCRTVAYFNQINLIPSYRYLVYVRDREILRAEEIVDWPIGLTTDEELALIREQDGS